MTTLLGGRYAIERRIGEGGMAEVLLAKDRANGDRPVVVKRCRAHLKHQPEFAHLFLREARLASLVNHPNVVSLQATGDDDGQPYLVMEYLQGFTVRDIFIRASTEGGIPQDVAAAIILGAARGLQAAHEAKDERGQPIGLVHRDVSPHNLFLTDGGVVKVLDFGIAKGAHDVTMTRAGHVKGKASYLSPEQLVAGGDVDSRADLFSLGTIAWELFTGQRLFKRASETDTINAIRSLKVGDPIAARPELDVAYAETVMRLLKRDPDARLQHASEVVTALESSLKRRAPNVGPGELAQYVAHIRQVAPAEDAPVSLRPSAPPAPLDRAGKARAFEEAWGSAGAMPVARAPTPSRARPPEHEEATATVAPPVEGAWLSSMPAPPNGEPPVDGSVVGTWAVAGARRPGVDNSGGYALLDPDDLVLEASKSEQLPMGALPHGAIERGAIERGAVERSTVEGDGDDDPTTAFIRRSVPPPSFAPEPPPPSPSLVPRNAPLAPLAPIAPPRRTYSPQIERLLLAYPRLEKLIHAQPKPELVAAILAGALVAGLVLAYVIVSIAR